MSYRSREARVRRRGHGPRPGEARRLPVKPALRARALPLVLAAALCGCPDRQTGVQPASDDRWNILLIVADDVGIDQIGVTYADHWPEGAPGDGGVPLPCTPRLDRLACEGMRFRNAWASPLCSPSRAQILTGRTCRTTGVGNVTLASREERLGLRPSQTTIATLLSGAGYRCAGFGKWHLADPSQTEVDPITQPLELGFERFEGTLYNLDSPSGLDAHYDHWKKTMLWPGSTVHRACDGYATTETTDAAIEWVRTEPGPWFLYVAYNASHMPHHSPALHGYLPCAPRTSCPGDCPVDWCADCPERASSAPCPFGNDEICQTRAMTQAMDAEIGRLLDVLPQKTAVLFLSDNGSPGAATVAPFDPAHAKGSLYEEGIRVPLFVRVPGLLPAGGVCDELASATDLFATIAELAGVPVTGQCTDSISLLQYRDPTLPHCGGASPRRLLYSEQFDPSFVPEPAGGPPSGYEALHHFRAIRDARFKLIERRESGRETEYLFFDLRSDPLEQQPCDPGDAPGVFGELLAALQDGYPPLPTGENPGKGLLARTMLEAGLLADGTVSCEGRLVRLAALERAEYRAFLEFPLQRIPPGARVLDVQLELNLLAGADASATRVEVRPLGSFLPGQDCRTLFESFEERGSYAVVDGWQRDFVFKRFSLGAEAALDLEAHAGAAEPADRRLTIGLAIVRDAGAPEDELQLRKFDNKLYVSYVEPEGVEDWESRSEPDPEALPGGEEPEDSR